jgi:hypothetical protein
MISSAEGVAGSEARRDKLDRRRRGRRAKRSMVKVK